MPEPTFCQYDTQHRPCEAPGAFVLTFRSATGYQHTEAACRSHADVRKRDVAKIGGTLVAVQEIEQPAPVRPEPVGLDAVDPAPATKAATVRAPRRRKARKL